MSFEQGNQAAKKDESQLSQTKNAERMRERHAEQKAAAEAAKRRAAAVEAAKRASMVEKFGQKRVETWESLQIAGLIVHDLIDYFFGFCGGGPCVTNDTNAEEMIDDLSQALEGCEPDREMPPTKWDEFRKFVGYARRLGIDLDVNAANCRDYFGYWLKVKRGEIIRDPLKRASWRQQAPAPVVAENPVSTPEPAPANPEWTTPPEPPAPRPTIPIDLQDALTAFWAAQRQ